MQLLKFIKDNNEWNCEDFKETGGSNERDGSS